MTHSPVIIFGAGALLVTGTLAWVLKVVVDSVGRAAALFPKERA